MNDGTLTKTIGMVGEVSCDIEMRLPRTQGHQAMLSATAKGI